MVAGKKLNFILHMIFILTVAGCLFPILLLLVVSFTDNSTLLANGYSLFPAKWSLEAYRYIFFDPTKILRAYGVTIFNTVVGALLSVSVIVLYAYPLSRPDFKLRKVMTFYIFFTMLFSGGTVSWYIVCTSVYHLSNTVWSMILPSLMSAWYVIIMRTFFKTSVPISLIESGKLDGASELRILIQLVLPISLPGVATVTLFQVLYYWNDWWLPIMFVVEPKLYNLQFLLQQMMQNIQMLNESPEYAQVAMGAVEIPSEGARMALCFVALGPILVVYPFFQKYFIQGLTVGSIKE